MLNKICTSCGVDKPLAMYGKAKTCKDGHRNYCKGCHRVRKELWRSKNIEHCLAKNRKWCLDNPEKAKAAYKKSSDKRGASGKAQITKKQCRLKNPHLYRAIVNSRRRKVRLATPKWVDRETIKQIYLAAQKQGLTVDHIIPINHPDVCGLHVPNNMQLITLKENTMKSNRFNGYVDRAKKI